MQKAQRNYILILQVKFIFIDQLDFILGLIIN